MTFTALVLVILTNIIFGLLQFVLFRFFVEAARREIEEAGEYVKKLTNISLDYIIKAANKTGINIINHPPKNP